MANNENTDKNLILRRFLPYRLSTLSNHISRAIADQYEERFSISLSEWRTIAVLGEESDISAADVADRTAMDKVAVSRAVKSLLQAGRIERHFSPDDRRRSVLALSKSGHDIYRQVVPIALSYESALLEGLTNEEKLFLDKILDKLDEIQLHTVADKS